MGYSIASSAVGFIQGSISEQWMVEYIKIAISEDVYTSYKAVFAMRTIKWLILLEVENSNSFERQLLGFGWDDSNGFAYR